MSIEHQVYNGLNDFSRNRAIRLILTGFFFPLTKEKSCLILIIQRKNTNNIYHAIVSMPRVHRNTHVANPNYSEVFFIH